MGDRAVLTGRRLTIEREWLQYLAGAAGLGLLLGLLEVALRRRHRRARSTLDDPRARPLGRWADPGARAGAWRIVALGDSVTHGWPRPAELAYPALLEARLQAARPDRPVAVINAGVPGQTAVQGLDRLERDALDWEPHLLIIAFGSNDAGLQRRPADAGREQRLLYPAPWEPLRCWHLWRTLLARLSRLHGGRPPLSEAPAWRAPRLSPAGFERAVRQICRTASRRCPIWLVTMPAPLVEPEETACRRRYNAIIRRVAAAEGAALLDVERLFAGAPGLVAEDGIHLTPAGQQRLANLLCVGILNGTRGCAHDERLSYQPR